MSYSVRTPRRENVAEETSPARRARRSAGRGIALACIALTMLFGSMVTSAPSADAACNSWYGCAYDHMKGAVSETVDDINIFTNSFRQAVAKPQVRCVFQYNGAGAIGYSAKVLTCSTVWTMGYYF